MKSVAALALSLGCWLGSSGCDQSPVGDPVESLAQEEALLGGEDLDVQGASLVCIPVENTILAGAHATFVYANARFRIFDVPCGISNVEDLRYRLSLCLAGGFCGNPVSFPTISALLQPFLQGQGVLARVGTTPVEVYRSGGRVRVLIDRGRDPIPVLYALRGTLQPPNPPCPPTGCFKSAEDPDAPGDIFSAGAGEETQESARSEVASLSEVIAGLPCCPGCGPCSLGQCEPRPVASPRSEPRLGYECQPCAIVCTEQTPICECRDRCVRAGACT